MGGICVLCNNLESRLMFLDDKAYDICHCNKGKYESPIGKEDIVIVEGYYSKSVVIKQSKSIKGIQENCDSWDDRLKGKSSSVILNSGK